MATLKAWRGTAAASSSLPSLQYKAELGQHIWVPPGADADYGTVLPVGLQLIFDYGAFWEGEARFKPTFDDSRMRLRGTELPPFSGEEGYQGGIKLNVMVQRHGLCSFLNTSESVYRAIDLLYGAFCFATEAQQGQLPVYRIEAARPFNTKFRPTPLYAPVYTPIGWVGRDANAFGPRLLPPPPKPVLMSEVTTAPALESDQMFDLPSSKTAPLSNAREKSLVGADLDDEIPF